MYLNVIAVLVSEGQYGVNIIFQLVHAHTDTGYIAVFERIWGMVGKAEDFQTAFYGGFYIFTFRADCLVSSGGVGMIIYFHNVSFLVKGNIYNNTRR